MAFKAPLLQLQAPERERMCFALPPGRGEVPSLMKRRRAIPIWISCRRNEKAVQSLRLRIIFYVCATLAHNFGPLYFGTFTLSSTTSASPTDCTVMPGQVSSIMAIIFSTLITQRC